MNRFMPIAIIFASVSLAADTPPPDAPRSPAAVAAIRKRDIAVERARTTFVKAQTDANRQMVDELDAALKIVMAAGNIDEANRINAAKKDASVSQASPGAAVIFSTVWTMTENGAKIRYTADGLYHCDRWASGDVGHWKAVDDSTFTQKEPDGTIIKTTFTADRRAAIYEYMSGGKAGAVSTIAGTKAQ
jgi:hypothetical protein